MSIEKRMLDKLNERRGESQLRSLIISSDLVDYSSNDYLGLARNYVLTEPVEAGSSGSRLLTGNYPAIESLEKRIARIALADTALFYSSGYSANVGLLSCLPQRNDIVLYDELVHASIRDGLRLSNAKSFSFKHNDYKDLESKLEKWEGEEIFVVLETVYSMDGDGVDKEVVKYLYKKYRFNLVIDEAHSFGLTRNDPFIEALGSIALARVITFGKAFGCDGAAVLGSDNLRNYLINYSRSFIYSTAPSPHKIAMLNAQFDVWESLEHLNRNAQQLKKHFIECLSRQFQLISGEYGNIVGMVLGSVDKAKAYSKELQRGGFDVRPILSPTVPKGTERLRFCFHEFNTGDEVDRMISLLLKIKKEVG